MLRIHQHTSAAACQTYYSAGDYYTEKDEALGRWGGQGAERLGLRGDVTQFDFDRMCRNLDPQTGTRLTARTRGNRTVAYDFNFHVPKSVSLVDGLVGDQELRDAFRDAVDATMRELEPEAKTRVRVGGKDDERTTGNLVWATFVHRTTRPVNGLPDPHLHAHAVVFNATYDDTEHRWKAGQFRDLKRDAPYWEAAFHARLAERLREQDFAVERTAKGWELAGIEPATVAKFSRRTALIEAEAAAKGIADPEAKAALGAKTREKKTAVLRPDQLKEAWRNLLTAGERDALDRLATKQVPPTKPESEPEKHALRFAVDHAFERAAVVPEKRLLASALKRGVGQVNVEAMKQELLRKEVIRRDYRGQAMTTTPAALTAEQTILRFARTGRGSVKPLGKRRWKIAGERLNAGQRQAATTLLDSKDRVQLLIGRAGVGKTTLLAEVKRHIEDGGHRVVALAPSAAASHGVLRKEGFPDADTVAAFLANEKLQETARGQVLMVDEAGLLGNRTLAALCRVAEDHDCRLLLVGDPLQHTGVEAGAPLALLEHSAGVKPVYVEEIQRQKGHYKKAVQSLAAGDAAAGFDQLDQLGWVHEVGDDERPAKLAEAYVAAVQANESTLVVAPTHVEGEAVTAAIRARMQAEGLLGKEREYVALKNAQLTDAERTDPLRYMVGDVVEFRQATPGFRRGERWRVAEVSDQGVAVERDGKAKPFPLDEPQRFDVFHAGTLHLAKGDRIRIARNGKSKDGKRLDNGTLASVAGFTRDGDLRLDTGAVLPQGFGHFAYGYATTSHSSQGRTVDRVLIAQSSVSLPASSREQFYVSASRGRQRLDLFTDDKEALRHAIARPEQRLSATELLQGERPPTRTNLLTRQARNVQRLAAFAKQRAKQAALAVRKTTDKWVSKLQEIERDRRRERGRGYEYGE